MAMDHRKRQKKLDKQKAKKKAERRELARRASQGLGPRFKAAADAPILHCCVYKKIWQEGIGQLLLSRSLSNGSVAFAVFLVDVYCLGVKNAYADIRPRVQYEEKLYNDFRRQFEVIALTPECARKLVEGAVQYAESIGLPPHADYRLAKQIFGDISAESCNEEFVYGKDGKPFFIAGPHDDEYRCRHILKTMESHLGPDGYHFLVSIDDPSSLVMEDVSGESDTGTLHLGRDEINSEQ
jgi:hypothetical protein